MNPMSTAVDEALDPPIRTIHHFACTGGTLICKCLSSLPNVRIVSEISPFSTLQISGEKPIFAPTDLTAQLIQSNWHQSSRLVEELFRSGVSLMYEDARRMGQRLLLREHNHSQFCLGAEISQHPDIRALLSEKYRLLSVISVRDPIDSFLSLENMNWVHFKPPTFTEYCVRYQAFIESFLDIPMFKYENFVSNPQPVLKQICAHLHLPFIESFEENFGAVKLSGDSGRKATTIQPRQRRDESQDRIDRMMSLNEYTRLVELMEIRIQATDALHQ